MANKHVAHRVGDLEQAAGIAVLEPSPGPRRVAGVGVLRVHMLGPHREVPKALSEICSTFGAALQSEADAKTDALTEQLNTTADLDDLYRRAVRLPEKALQAEGATTLG